MAKPNKLSFGNQSSSLTALRRDKIKCVKSSVSAPADLGKEKKTSCDDAFQNWLKIKREEQLMKQEQERKMKRMIEEQAKMKKEAAELSFALWKHKKIEQIKANEVKEKQLKEKQEQKKNLMQQVSKERVSQWMNTSKYKPRPVPSNKGLLSLTASNPPSFFNPRPWVAPI